MNIERQCGIIIGENKLKMIYIQFKIFSYSLFGIFCKYSVSKYFVSIKSLHLGVHCRYSPNPYSGSIRGCIVGTHRTRIPALFSRRVPVNIRKSPNVFPSLWWNIRYPRANQRNGAFSAKIWDWESDCMFVLTATAWVI